MNEDAPLDLDGQMVIDDASVDDQSRPYRPVPASFSIRSEEDIPVGSLALGALIISTLIAAAASLWFAILILPLLWLGDLLL
jgi:hypothetical protein